MREELSRLGVQELLSPADVDRWMSDKRGTALLVINSVCGCAAGSARPGVALALQHQVRPDRLATVFAGQDVDAAAQARSYLTEVPPSSPSIALFRDGVLVHFVPRHMIEGRDAAGVASQLTGAFDKFCAAKAS